MTTFGLVGGRYSCFGSNKVDRFQRIRWSRPADQGSKPQGQDTRIRRYWAMVSVLEKHSRSDIDGQRYLFRCFLSRSKSKPGSSFKVLRIRPFDYEALVAWFPTGRRGQVCARRGRILAGPVRFTRCAALRT